MKEKIKKTNCPKTEQDKLGPKLPYQTPTITPVSLFADQVLGGGCNKLPGGPCELTPPLIIS